MEKILNPHDIFFIENDANFKKNKTINIEEFIKDLPAKLNTGAKTKFLRAFGKNINKLEINNTDAELE